MSENNLINHIEYYLKKHLLEGPKLQNSDQRYPVL